MKRNVFAEKLGEAFASVFTSPVTAASKRQLIRVARRQLAFDIPGNGILRRGNGGKGSLLLHAGVRHRRIPEHRRG